MNRRTLLRAGVGLSTALASGPNKADTPTVPCQCDGLSAAARFNCETDVCAEASHDFGNIVHRLPRAVLKPAGTADIAEAIRWAAAQKLKIAARGQGHSTYGRSMASDGVVVDMGSLNAIRAIGTDRIVVDAGATWKSVLEATLAQGLTPPVLTNYLGLSVGGTLAVGGIGGTSSRFGMQSDQLIELDVVTGDGRELKCSRESNPDLFDAMRGGLAQCGIITRATLALVRAPERVRRYQLFYRDLASLVADQRSVLAADRFDQLQGAIIPDGKRGWRYQLEGAVHYSGSIPDNRTVLAGLSDIRDAAVITDLTYHDDARVFEKLETLLRSKELWYRPQPWLFTFLPGSKAERAAGELMRGLSGDDVGTFGRVTFYPMLTKAFGSPLVRLPDDSTAFPFNVVRVAADKEKVGQMVAQNHALYDRVREAGGVLYPVSAFPMSSDGWKQHFGSRWPQFAEAKRRYDPEHLLTPGYEMF
ncbi:FAD-binding protein [Bradyrhizobium lablabi]|uniref:FAD-binding protein n=1 Tax=Bradyrhizobium lablabi TaxID=722472 RepID=UPI001BA8BB5F|nr:FAD-binding protein [Bradyrhizobium lablabi]MBR1121718.1 FAD-binding protein [Bradyrhizobium lablabi]